MKIWMNFDAYGVLISILSFFFTCKRPQQIHVWFNHVEILVKASNYIGLLMQDSTLEYNTPLQVNKISSYTLLWLFRNRPRHLGLKLLKVHYPKLTQNPKKPTLCAIVIYLMTSYTWTLKPYQPRSYRLGILASWAGQGLRPVISPYHIHDGSDSVNDTLMTRLTGRYWKLQLPAAITVFLSIEPSDSDLPHSHH